MVSSQEGPLVPLVSGVTISSQNRNNADSAHTRQCFGRAAMAVRCSTPGGCRCRGDGGSLRFLLAHATLPQRAAQRKRTQRWSSGMGVRSCCPSARSPKGPALRGQASAPVSESALNPPRVTGRVALSPVSCPHHCASPGPAAAPKSTDSCSGISLSCISVM